MHRVKLAIPALILLCCPLALARELIVRPTKGQSEVQQQKDESECGAWAARNTRLAPLTIAQSRIWQPCAFDGDSRTDAQDAAAVRARQVAEESLAAYMRAYHACLEWRGYTVR
jgi:hypothetical protein